MPTYPDVKSDLVNGVDETDANQINNIEDYVGIRTDIEPTCLTYKLVNPLSIGPGHKHPVADLDGGTNGTICYKDPADGIWKAWLPDTAGILTKGDEQTIIAKKTFSILPEANITPTSDNQLARKKYVDDLVVLPKYAGMMRNDYGEIGDPLIFYNHRQALGGFSFQALKGFTSVGSLMGENTSFTDNGNDTIKIESNAHGLITGDLITICGTTGGYYLGIYTVTRFDDNYFLISDTYIAETGGYWFKPSYLKVSAGGAGIYRVSVSVFLFGATMTVFDYHTIDVMQNSSHIPSLRMKAVTSYPYVTPNNPSRNALITLAENDILWIGQINASTDYICAFEADLVLNRIDV